MSEEGNVGPGSVDRPLGLAPTPAPRYASDVIVDVLTQLGCSFLAMTPGSSFRGIHDSVVNHGGNESPQLLLCHHEEVAVSLAHGYAKATRTPGFALVHDLVGLMHASMAAYNAWIDEAPVVIIGGGGPAMTTRRRTIDWYHSASTQAELVRDFVKWDAEPTDLAGTIDALEEAVAIATSAPQGPVYVTVDAAVQEEQLASRAPVQVAGRRKHGLELSRSHADWIVEELLAASFPVVLAGIMRYDPAATAAIVELSDALGVAGLNVEHSSVFPTAHQLNLDGDSDALRTADCVLGLGVRELGGFVEPLAASRDRGHRQTHAPTKVIDVGLRDLVRRGWSNAKAPVWSDATFVADPLPAVQALAAAARDRCERLSPAELERRAQRRHDAITRHDAARSRVRADAEHGWERSPVTPARLTAELRAAVQDLPWQLVLRNTRSWPDGLWELRDASDYLGHSGGSGTGYGPGAAVGAALGAWRTGRVAVGIVGDGDLAMAPGAIWTAVRYRVPLLLVVNDNRSFYNDEAHQINVARDRGRPVENAGIGAHLRDPDIDFATLARGYGAWAVGPIDEPGDLAPSLTLARERLVAGDVAVVHVVTGPVLS